MVVSKGFMPTISLQITHRNWFPSYPDIYQTRRLGCPYNDFLAGCDHLSASSIFGTRQVFVSTYAQWDDAKDDSVNKYWLKRMYDELQEIARSRYINEYDLETRAGETSKCFAAENWERLQRLRLEYDPDGVFVDVQQLRSMAISQERTTKWNLSALSPALKDGVLRRT